MDDPRDESPELQLLSRDDLEQRVRARTAYLQNLMDTMVDVLIELDGTGTITEVNRACEATLGYGTEAIEGKPVDFLFADETVQAEFDTQLAGGQFVERLLADGQLTDFEVIFETAAGGPVPMSLSASVMYDDGSIEGMVCVGKDISERKQAEQRAEFLHSLLRHDLTNRLQVTQGNIELALESADGETESLLETARTSIEKAAELIDDVRTLEQLGGDADREPVGLDEAVTTVLAQYEGTASEAGMTIERDVPADARVLAGPLLAELVANLVENAIEHSGGSEIHVLASRDGDTVTLAVEDDGTGIPPEPRDGILDRGVKGEGSTGSGLGTYLSRQIAEAYDSELTVGESALGGARFAVSFDVATDTVPRD